MRPVGESNAAWMSQPPALREHAPAADAWSVVADPAALVVPSREDPLPLVALEAGARAVPVVATATGGLTDLLADGRGTLAPGSDVDLLFLLPYKQTPWGESVVEFILYMLWDLRLKVGHATRSVAECIRQARADMTIRTSILEARYILGDESLFKTLVARFDAEVVKGTVQAFIVAKLAERDDRHRVGRPQLVHERVQGVLDQVEPAWLAH